MTDKSPAPAPAGERLAKVIARAGLCSRRDAEVWIKEGRVTVNGKPVKSPAFNVTPSDTVKVDGETLAARQGTRVWLYHKPAGLVVTEKDPEGRPTIFEALLEKGLPRVVSIGRLDINTEGLLLLTNDGGLKRVLELPATGWLRRYRVRAFGKVTQAELDTLKNGIEIEGIKYGPIEAEFEREQGANVWLTLGLREGKNREVKNVLGALGLQVNRLIRTSYGPFQLGDIPIGHVEVVKARVLKEQLGKRLAEEAEVDFDSEMPEPAALVMQRRATVKANERLSGRGTNTADVGGRRFRFTDRAERSPEEQEKLRLARRAGPQRGRFEPEPEDDGNGPRVLFDDGREPVVYKKKNLGRIRDTKTAEVVETPRAPRRPREEGDARPARGFGDKPFRRSDKPEGDRPKRPFGDKPRRDGDRPARAFEDRPRRGSRPEGDDRPKRAYGDRPPRGPRPEGDDRPRRAFGDRPARPPRGEGEDRPKRAFGDKPRGKPFGDKPRAPRADGDRPARAGKPFGDKPFRPKSPGGKPAGARPSGGKPSGGKPSGGPRKPRAPRGA